MNSASERPLAVVLEVSADLSAGHLRAFVQVLDALQVEDERVLAHLWTDDGVQLSAWAGPIGRLSSLTARLSSCEAERAIDPTGVGGPRTEECWVG